jgi:phosphate transport system permease protein
VNPYALLFLVAGLGVIAWLTGRARAARFGAASKHRLHSLPGQHGLYVAMWTVIPTVIFVIAWNIITPSLATDAVLRAPR